MDKPKNRLNRLLDRLERAIPKIQTFLVWLRKPATRLVRIPFAVLLVLGGLFSILPGLGIWMLPLGLLLLAIDLPMLREPTTRIAIIGQRQISRMRRVWQEWRQHESFTPRFLFALVAIIGPLTVLGVALIVRFLT